MSMANTHQAPLFDRIAIIGHGLIGSSISRAIRRSGNVVGHIAVADMDTTNRERSLALEIADSVHADPLKAVAGADCVVLCTPVGTYGALAEQIAPALQPGAILTDVGSIKCIVSRDIAPHLPAGVHLIPGHPLAGTEKSGPDAGFAEMFEGRYWVLTPAANCEPAAIERLTALWQHIGAIVEIMDEEYHDKVLALTSHLPHLISYTIVGTATDLEEHMKRDVIRFAASGFRDFTRLAGSNPVMWRDVFLNNREAVLEMLQRFQEDLTYLQRAIRWGDGDTLEKLFTRTREIRRGVIDAKQDIPPHPKEPAPKTD
jgi:cyclohexadieny/prephenate dehydrogenase